MKLTKTNKDKTAIDRELLRNLAEVAYIKIIDNKILQETIKMYNNQADTIKYLIVNYSGSLKSCSKSKTLKDFEDYNSHLNLLIKKIKSKIQKLIIKNMTITKKLIENSSINEEKYAKTKEDNFILKNSIMEKNLIIKTAKEIHEAIHFINETRIIDKFESEINERASVYFLDKLNLNVQQKLLCWSKAFNNQINKNNKKIKKINELKKKIEFFKKYIELFEFIPKNSNDNSKINNNINILNTVNNTPQINITFQGIVINNNFYTQPNQTQTKNKLVVNSTKNINRLNIYDGHKIFNNVTPEKKKRKSKVNLLKIDELLSISNIICENENLIDTVLHSDDEVVFEKTLQPNKTLIDDYSSKISKIVPKLDFNQIEFNKLKVMDECDMYSLRKRKYKNKDINEVVEITKDEIQKYKEKIKLNKKKLNAMKSYIKELKNDYKLLKNIKLTSSICMPNQIPYFTTIPNINKINIKKQEINDENNRYNYMDMNSDDENNNEIISTEEENENDDEDNNVIINFESEDFDKKKKINEFNSAKNVRDMDKERKKSVKSEKVQRKKVDKNGIKNHRFKLSCFVPKSK